MAEFEEYTEGTPHGTVRTMINKLFVEMRGVRRPWATPFDGDKCHYNGVDYNFTGSGSRNTEPGTAGGAVAWQAVDYSAPPTPVASGGLIVARGLKSDLEAIPASTTIDLFIVEKEPIGVHPDPQIDDAFDWNGRYWKTWVEDRYFWVRD